MTQLVIDSQFRERLREVRESVEFVDETGCVLGFFCPISRPFDDLSLAPPISDEERQRLRSEPGEFTTDEVLRHLESLSCSP